MTHTLLRWFSGAASHVGHVRKINEDAYLDSPHQGLWAVADGMGGHAMGDVASRMIVDALARLPSSEKLERDLTLADECLLNVNEALREKAASCHTSVIGSTAVVFLARGNQCAYLWAGDSRLYLYRNQLLQRLTRDHSQVEEMLAAKLLTTEQAATYPGRNLITRAVGAFDTLEIDTGLIDAESNDLYLLCSDGLTNEVNEEEIVHLLENTEFQDLPEALVQAALQHGARDNVTVVAVRAESQ